MNVVVLQRFSISAVRIPMVGAEEHRQRVTERPTPPPVLVPVRGCERTPFAQRHPDVYLLAEPSLDSVRPARRHGAVERIVVSEDACAIEVFCDYRQFPRLGAGVGVGADITAEIAYPGPPIGLCERFGKTAQVRLFRRHA